jgi:hypothetical protein
MLRKLTLVAVAATLAGCASDGNGTAPLAAQAQIQAKTLELAASPPEQSRIGLYRDEDSVRVGDTWEKAKLVFPVPPHNADEIHDLPNGIPEKFEAHGWETPSGEGFGVITVEGKVVLAMYQLEKTKSDTVSDFEKTEEQHVGVPETVTGRSLTYWFWSDPEAKQSLMICALKVPAGYNFTMAMGDDNVLERLGISRDGAKKEIRGIDGISSILRPSGQR